MNLLINNKRFNSCLVTYTYKGCEKYLNRFKKTIHEQTFKNFDVLIFNDKGNLKNFKINHSHRIINNSKSIFKNRVESLKYIFICVFQHTNLGTLEVHVLVCLSSPEKYCITSQAVKSRSQKCEEETALSISRL